MNIREMLNMIKNYGNTTNGEEALELVARL
jgi:hypothetical protein